MKRKNKRKLITYDEYIKKYRPKSLPPPEEAERYKLRRIKPFDYPRITPLPVDHPSEERQNDA